uniref:Uncharacterized protein n=2 Tax=Schistocephalus solidus TaxID=70667 RepID=A0A0X3P5A7_SCHSO
MAVGPVIAMATALAVVLAVSGSIAQLTIVQPSGPFAGQPKMESPTLPVRFFNDFLITYTPRDDEEMPMPPWIDAIPPALPYAIGRGSTWYAADLNMAIENYTDYCIPIFKPASYFPCTFINVNSTAYLVSPKEYGYGPCCIYRPNWAIPHRDFMRAFENNYNGSTESLGHGVLNQTIDWWIIPENTNLFFQSKKVKSHPVFGGFGWARKTMPSGFKPYVSFWYEGDIGWTHQVFDNFTDTGPNIKYLETYKLPEECNTALTCLYG